jgi:multiple sugar transport system permease protein
VFGLGTMFRSAEGYNTRTMAIIAFVVCVGLGVAIYATNKQFEKNEQYKSFSYPFMNKFNLASTITLIALLFITLFPFYVVIINSLKHSSEANALGFTFFPEQGITFSHYTTLFNNSSGIGINLVTSFFNSLIYASFPVFAGVFVSAFAAYGFAKLDYPGRSTVYQIMIFTMMVPGCVSMSSSYVLFDSFGWTQGVGLSLPLIVPRCFGAIGTVMFLREYFKGVPDDMLAAARIDGCGKLHVFTAIMVPLGMPAIIAQLVLGFIGAYNDYQSALIYLKYPEQYTIQLALSFFNGGYSDKALASAGAVFGIVPLLVLYIIFQNKIIAGISFSSGLKG